ncbi:hypothetical protein K4F52_004740 [Lecanicillium sp. MT-2017a]|nr:hypothetical protein K4F52_004740 [Lecanicillium sp. MT-2017a]
MEVHVIIVSGRAGSGKTSTANEMSEQLSRLEVKHAHIDGDNLDAVYPEEDGADMLLANLTALCSNYYHRRGVDRFILSGTALVLETSRITDAIRRATGTIPLLSHVTSSSSSPQQRASTTSPPGSTGSASGSGSGRPSPTTHVHNGVMPPASVNTRAFILTASDALAAERLKRREVGTELPKLLRSTQRMASVLDSEIGGWARRVYTDRRAVKDIALDILRAAGWM